MDFVTSSSRWLASLDPLRAAPGFTERLSVASEDRPHGPRSLAAPYYLTDLGVRAFEDPRLFLMGHLDLLGREHASDPVDDAALLGATPVDALAHRLDTFVLVTGDYKTAHEVISARLEELLDNGSTTLLIQVGVLLAAAGDERSRAALNRAAQVTQHPTDRFMALHRLAAAEIKRFSRAEVGMRILEQIDDEIDDAQLTGALSPGDRVTLLSVTANLRALALIHAGRPIEVRAEIVRARGLHTLEDLREVLPGEASRYGAQERINLAQVLDGDGDTAASVGVLEENVEYCRTHNEDYLGEALAALAYGQFRAGAFRKAAAVASEAAQRIAFEASPTRLRAAREIQIAAYFSADDVEQARTVLITMESDPLGLSLSRPELAGSVVA